MNSKEKREKVKKALKKALKNPLIHCNPAKRAMALFAEQKRLRKELG